MKRENLNILFGNILSQAAGFSPQILAIAQEDWVQIRAEFSAKARGHKEETVEKEPKNDLPEAFQFLADDATILED